MLEHGFIDCHSHLAPTGDDGVRTVDEGVEQAGEAADSGTGVLFLTPHVWAELPMHAERERRFREAVDRMRERLEGRLELRIGFELTPAPNLLDQDMARYALEGTALCLVETPFAGGLSLFQRLAEHVEAAGLTPLIAHPERAPAIAGNQQRLAALLERGWPVQVTGGSLTGRNGNEAERAAWHILQTHPQAVVASDGHRAYRPARLDAAWAAAVAKLGEERAEQVFGGADIPGLAPAATA